jgi:hypothetical protein
MAPGLTKIEPNRNARKQQTLNTAFWPLLKSGILPQWQRQRRACPCAGCGAEGGAQAASAATTACRGEAAPARHGLCSEHLGETVSQPAVIDRVVVRIPKSSVGCDESAQRQIRGRPADEPTGAMQVGGDHTRSWRSSLPASTSAAMLVIASPSPRCCGRRRAPRLRLPLPAWSRGAADARLDNSDAGTRVPTSPPPFKSHHLAPRSRRCHRPSPSRRRARLITPSFRAPRCPP